VPRSRNDYHVPPCSTPARALLAPLCCLLARAERSTVAACRLAAWVCESLRGSGSPPCNYMLVLCVISRALAPSSFHVVFRFAASRCTFNGRPVSHLFTILTSSTPHSFRRSLPLSSLPDRDHTRYLLCPPVDLSAFFVARALWSPSSNLPLRGHRHVSQLPHCAPSPHATADSGNGDDAHV
jgi:hypothetical protein